MPAEILDRCRHETAKMRSGVSDLCATPEKVKIFCGKVMNFN